MEYTKGQIIYASGCCGIVLDTFSNSAGEKVYKIYFAKNAVRLQPAELVHENTLVDMRVASEDELRNEVDSLKGLVSMRILDFYDRLEK